MADEDQDEKIDWREFLDIGIKMIKTIYSRNIARQNYEHTHIDKSLEVIFSDEIKRTSNLLNYKFRKVDYAKNGRVSLEAFKHIIRETRFLTPKEKNLIIRLQSADTIEYRNFPKMIYEVRHDIAMSELMETEISELESDLIRNFRRFEH